MQQHFPQVEVYLVESFALEAYFNAFYSRQ